MVKTVGQCFQKTKRASSDVLFFPQPKDVKCTVTAELSNHKYPHPPICRKMFAESDSQLKIMANRIYNPKVFDDLGMRLK